MKKVFSIILTACILFIPSDLEYPPYYKIIYDMGFKDVLTVPEEIVEVTIPQDFNKVYQRYNELLKKEGYDLLNYKGKKCQRYTYLIPSKNARGNILVYQKKVIGGDICGITIDSVMIPIKKCDLGEKTDAS